MLLLKNIARNILFAISLLFRTFTNVHKNRVLCMSYGFTKYSCNPKYITEYLLHNCPNEYEIYWCFKKGILIPQLPHGIKTVRWRSLKYFYIVNTSAFIFSNFRLGKFGSYLKKKYEQRYVMTWHSSMGIKKIEKDVEDTLPVEYAKAAQYDSSMCDLIISGCRYRTEVIRRAFWYNGEILKKGTPRNDVLFQSSLVIKEKICKMYNLNPNAKLLLYAPTFRKDYNLGCYKFDWNDVRSVLYQKYKEDYCILLRLHPNFLNIPSFDLSQYLNDSVVDVTSYHDMQELLAISDILVTDYSSSLFDFALLYRPCFIYSTDVTSYDRGTYFNLNDLPFSVATTNEELLNNMSCFNLDGYKNEMKYFNYQIIGTYEKGDASKELYNWMLRQ